jgi:hypothetical protein
MLHKPSKIAFIGPQSSILHTASTRPVKFMLIDQDKIMRNIYVDCFSDHHIRARG